MTTPLKRRMGALAATAALVAGVAATAAPADAVPAPVTPLSISADWAAGQLTNGLVHDQQYNFDDIGGSINVAYDLLAAESNSSAITQIVNAVGGRLVGTQNNGVQGYIQNAEYDWKAPYAFVQDGYYANAAANALVFAQQFKQDPTTYGGTNLVTAVENRVRPTGRIADQSSYGDYANTIGQALAARGLVTADSSMSAKVLAFLLKQQCADGYFRLYPKADPDGSWTCDGGIASGKSPADSDTTALVMAQLLSLPTSDSTVAAALDKAEAWLLSQQRPGGGFGGGPSTPAPNTNSTGLAGAILGKLGNTAAARKAAVWVRKLQVQKNSCASKVDGQIGAIAYDGAALAAGRSKGIVVTALGQWRSATFQALPVLQWAPTNSGTLTASATSDYVQARSRTPIKVMGLAPGEAACVAPASAKISVAGALDGTAVANVPMLPGTANRIIVITRGTAKTTVTIKVLGAKKLGLGVSTLTPRTGHQVAVTLTGLAAGEKFTLTYLGKTIRDTRASADGTYSTMIWAGPVGKHVLSLRGQFANRSASATLTVGR